MKRVVKPCRSLKSLTPWLLSSLLTVGWVHAQPSPGNDIRESTDPSRAADVEQRARELGDTASPVAPAEAGSSTGDSTSGESTSGESTSGDATSGGTAPGASGASDDASGGSSTPDNTPYGTSGSDAYGGPDTTGATPGTTGRSSGGALKSGPEAGEMDGTQQLPRPGNERFTEPTQPAR